MPLPNLEDFGGTLKFDHNIMSHKHKHALGLQCSQHAMTCPALPCPAQWDLVSSAHPVVSLMWAIASVDSGTVHTATPTEHNALPCSLTKPQSLVSFVHANTPPTLKTRTKSSCRAYASILHLIVTIE